MRLLRDRHRMEDRQNDRVKREAMIEQPVVTGATPAGDGRKLRGIPAIGRGVSGAIGGTDPRRVA